MTGAGAWRSDFRAAVGMAPPPELAERPGLGLDGLTVVCERPLNPGQAEIVRAAYDLARAVCRDRLGRTARSQVLVVTESIDPARMSADGGRTLGLCHQLPSGRCVVLFPLGAIATDPHGLVHELVHSFGLCGIPMVDEGLAVLVERLAAEGFTPDALEDPHCAAAAGRIAASGRGARDIFTTGSAYLAGYLVAGWPELAREFDRLSGMAREQATARIRDGTAAGPLPEAERPAGDGDARNDMAADCGAAYFRGDFETLYRLVRDAPMPADEYRRNLARLHCVQANDDTGRHAHWDLPAPQGGPPPPGIDIFIDLVGRFAAMRTTRSREAFIEEARQSFDLIARLGGCAGMEIDALVLEIQSRRALPAFAGGSCDKALAACNELETTWRRPGLAERFRRAIEAER